MRRTTITRDSVRRTDAGSVMNLTLDKRPALACVMFTLVNTVVAAANRTMAGSTADGSAVAQSRGPAFNKTGSDTELNVSMVANASTGNTTFTVFKNIPTGGVATSVTITYAAGVTGSRTFHSGLVADLFTAGDVCDVVVVSSTGVGAITAMAFVTIT